MVRKTTAQVKETTKSSSSFSQDQIDFTSLLNNFWKGAQENWMTLAGFVLIVLGFIQLWEQIVGIIFLTCGILLISGFFSNDK